MTDKREEWFARALEEIEDAERSVGDAIWAMQKANRAGDLGGMLVTLVGVMNILKGLKAQKIAQK